MKTLKFTDLTKEQKQLLEEAEKVMLNAYNPTSHYFVGAAILTKKDKIITGTFAENSSLGLTICAEVTAICTANSLGERNFKTIAIIGKHEDFDSKEPITPCGRCRQFISDFAQIANTDIEIICSNTKKDKIYLTTISELLPKSFGPKDLGMDVKKYCK